MPRREMSTSALSPLRTRRPRRATARAARRVRVGIGGSNTGSAGDLGEVTLSSPGEEWIEFGPVGERRRIGFHDYDTLYRVPGLYDRVFGELLGVKTAEVVVALYAAALDRLARPPGLERVLDLGAGSGIGGELLRRQGVACTVAVDLEPAAQMAAARDRPGVYDAYHVGDLTQPETSLWRQLGPIRFSALLALSSVGVDAISADLMMRVVRALLAEGGLLAFAVADELLPRFHDDLFAAIPGMEPVATRRYVHRRRTDGSLHRATALVACAAATGGAPSGR